MDRNQVSVFDILDSQSGRMSQELFQATTATTSGASSKHSRNARRAGKFMCLDLRTDDGVLRERSWRTSGVWRGEHWMPNTGEYPNAERESTLSQILEANAPEKYYLSPTACQGIINRAKRRGKELPKMLKDALEEVVRLGLSADREPRQGTSDTKTGYHQPLGGGITSDVVCLNDQGGNVMSVSEGVTSTLRAQAHQHEPTICYDGQNCGWCNNATYTLTGGRIDDHHLSVICQGRNSIDGQGGKCNVVNFANRTYCAGDTYDNISLTLTQECAKQPGATVCYAQGGFADYVEQNPLIRASGGDLGGAVKGS